MNKAKKKKSNISMYFNVESAFAINSEPKNNLKNSVKLGKPIHGLIPSQWNYKIIKDGQIGGSVKWTKRFSFVFKIFLNWEIAIIISNIYWWAIIFFFQKMNISPLIMVSRVSIELDTPKYWQHKLSPGAPSTSKRLCQMSETILFS